MANYYDGLLRLCGFEDEDIEEERPRLEASFERLGIGPEDVETAESWVSQKGSLPYSGRAL